MLPKSGSNKFHSAITLTSWWGEQATDAATIPIGQWKQAALVISGDTNSEVLYLDGVEVARNSNLSLKPSDIYDASKDFSGYIGKSFYSGDPYFSGAIDDFRIYNRALSASEIKTIFNPNISNITALNYITKPGILPVLPQTVKVDYCDGLMKKLPVAWDTVEPSVYAADGKFVIEGTVEGTTFKAKANIIVDSTAPVTSVLTSEKDSNGWYNSEVHVTLNAVDSLSGVNSTEYRIGTEGSWLPYTEAFVITEEGSNLVQYRSTDNAGNQEDIKEAVIKIDKTKPSFSLKVDGNTLNENAAFEDYLPLTFQAEDSLSGIATAKIKLNDNTYSLDSGNASLNIDMAGKIGSNTAYITVVDKAGNVLEKEFTFAVTTSISSIRHLIDRYTAANSLTGPLVDQLANNLNQAQHQMDIGHLDQAVKHEEDFIKHLNNAALESHVSDNSKAALNADAEALIK
jgi:hypothetical protein